MTDLQRIEKADWIIIRLLERLCLIMSNDPSSKKEAIKSALYLIDKYGDNLVHHAIVEIKRERVPVRSK